MSNGDTVFSYVGPSMAAAMVAHTANRTADLAIQLSAQHHASLASSNQYIYNIPGTPEAFGVTRSRWEGKTESNLDKLKRRKPIKLSAPDIDLDGKIRTFAVDMLAAMEQLFPGLRAAAQKALANAGRAIWNPAGHHHDEAATRAAVEAEHAKALYDAQQATRTTVASAAAGRHRFLPGASVATVAQIHGESRRAGIGAAAAAYSETAGNEYALRLQMAKAALDARAQAIHGFASAMTQAFNRRRSAETAIANDLMSAISGKIDTNLLRYEQRNRIEQIVMQAASDFTAADVRTAIAADPTQGDRELGRAVFDQYVEALGSQAATLYNQLRGNAGLSGTDSDVTDYEII